MIKDIWTDMARDILEVVVDGPEADRTWQTYQTEAGTSSETDEEQMEKMLLGDSVWQTARYMNFRATASTPYVKHDIINCRRASTT